MVTNRAVRRRMRLWLALVFVMGAIGCDKQAAQGGAGSAGNAGSGGTGGVSVGGSGGISGCGGLGSSGAGIGGCAGDQCGGYWSEPTQSISATPGHMVTNVAADATIGVYMQSIASITAEQLDTLALKSRLVRLADDAEVAATIAVQSAPSAWVNTASLTLMPAEPLTEGWYTFEINGPLDTESHPSITIPERGPEQHAITFRVGSGPILIRIDGGIPMRFNFSEPVVLPEPPPIELPSPPALAAPCGRDNPNDVDPALPVLSALIYCADTTADLYDLTFSEGIVSATGVPLRNAAGETRFTLSVPAQGGTMDRWVETTIPTF